MKWSWKIARVEGIDVTIHATFLVFLGWVAVSYWLTERSLPKVAEGVVYLLALFGSVLLHEFGHALTAKRFGIKTRDITLLPIGGVARLERMPEKPIQELWVALTGPAVNVVIAIILLAGLLLTGSLQPLNQLSITTGNFFERLMLVNVWLALFNLIPAFPMDGGRVVRSLLAMRLEYTRATQIAATLGQGMAFLLGFWGLFNNPTLVFIALFVWIGAAQEANMVTVKSALAGIPVNRAMLTDYHTLTPADPLQHAVDLVLSSSQQDFPVVVNGAVVGILTRDDLFRALTEHNETMLVSYVMQKQFDTISPNQMLDGLGQQMQAGKQNLLPVVQNGELIGIITLENIGEFLMIQRAKLARTAARQIG